MLLVLIVTALGRRASGGEAGWATGASLQRQLETEVSVAWSGAPLRDALARFGRAHGLAMMLDRRVDPDQELDLSLRRMTLRSALEKIAADSRLRVSLLGPLAYFGPPCATDRLRTLAALRADDVRRLPRRQQTPFVRRRSWRWHDLATPRELLLELAQQSGVKIRGLELVPHDLWCGLELPPLPLTERLTLVGNGFDLTFTITGDGSKVRLVPIRPPVVLERRYGQTHAGRYLLDRLAGRRPETQWRLEHGVLIVRGRLEEHEQLSSALSGPPVRPPAATRRAAPAPDTRYALTVKNQPVGTLLEYLGEKLHMDVRIDTDALQNASGSLATLVSFQVQNATVEQLLRAALEPAGLAFERQGNVVTIGPARR